MGFSWGGFSQGLERGLQTGDKLGSMLGDTQIAMLRAKGMKEAKESAAKAQADAPASVMDTGEQGAEQSAVANPAQAPVETFKVDMGPDAAASQSIDSGAHGRYVAGGKAFNDKGKAEAHAKSKAPTDMDFFMKNAVPQIAAKFIEQGDPEMAEKWTSYAGKKQTQKHMETWAKAKRATMSGDFESAADHVMDLYASYDDGVTPMGKEVVKDKDGNVTGFNVKLKDDATGEVRAQFISPQELDSGLGALAPTEMFKMTMAKQQQAEMIRVKSAADAANDARTMQRDVARQGMIENRADARTVAKESAANRRSAAEASQREKEIRLREELRGKRPERDARTVGLAPHPLKVDKEVRAEFKDDTTKYRVIGPDGKMTEDRFSKLPKTHQDALVKKIVEQRMGAYSKPVMKPASASYQGAPVYDPDEDEDD